MWLSDKWQDFELLDCSKGEKLERWGKYYLVRPDPQAIWDTPRHNKHWNDRDARYRRSETGGGSWDKGGLPSNWQIHYGELTFNVKPMNFKHTGLFPEQAANWDWAMAKIRAAGRPISVLNLFGYTGAATVACAKAGAQVCHVDAAKGMVAWGKENAAASGLADAPIRWIVDDCGKFVEREIRRGRRYDAIIMDPPSYGRGPGGEVWKLEQNHAISEEERSSYIGIYRLIAQVEKTDGAAIGSLYHQGAEITMRNLLSAVRTSKKGSMDYSVSDNFDGVSAKASGTKIDEQIAAGFQQNCVKDIMEQITPDKLATLGEDGWMDLTPEQFAQKLEEKGCPKVVVCDLAREDMAEAVEDAFRYGKLVLASITYNGEAFPFMRTFIENLTERNYQNRTIGLIENGSWAPTAAKVMKGMFEKSKNITWLENNVKIMSSLSDENVAEIDAMAEELCK